MDQEYLINETETKYCSIDIIKKEEPVSCSEQYDEGILGFSNENCDIKLILKKVNLGQVKLNVICEEDDEVVDNKVKMKIKRSRLRGTKLRYKRRSKTDNNVSNDKIKGRLKCKLCSRSYIYKGDLKRHVDEVHLNSVRFTCFYCDFSSTRKSGLKKHIIAFHMEDTLYGCKFCLYRAGSKYRLKSHVESVHLNINPTVESVYFCAYCSDWKTKYKDSLQRHFKYHHLTLFTSKFEEPKRQYRFTNCRFGKIESIQKFKCPQCPYTTNRKFRIRLHGLAKHSTDRLLKCPSCCFTTNFHRSLKCHMEYQCFKCNLCKSSFLTKLELLSHKNETHDLLSLTTEVSKFTCNYCCESFFSKHNMKKHIGLIHKDVFVRVKQENEIKKEEAEF